MSVCDTLDKPAARTHTHTHTHTHTYTYTHTHTHTYKLRWTGAERAKTKTPDVSMSSRCTIPASTCMDERARGNRQRIRRMGQEGKVLPPNPHGGGGGGGLKGEKRGGGGERVLTGLRIDAVYAG